MAATEHPIEALTRNDQRQPTNELQARIYGHACDALGCGPCTWKWFGERENAKQTKRGGVKNDDGIGTGVDLEQDERGTARGEGDERGGNGRDGRGGGGGRHGMARRHISV